jgi:XTP/dITP diphosphohydrolase
VLVYAATKNAGKFEELRSIFAPWGWQLEQHYAYEDVVEGDTSYDENAALKARALFARLRDMGQTAAVLGDDSGLEIAALGGRPGVHSARYGPPGATWSDRRRALHEELLTSGTADRRARFVCALHYIAPDARPFAVRCSLDGQIASSDRGVAGFSYDPLFVYPPLGLTFAEMDDGEKNRISHRARAAAALLDAVRSSDAAPDFGPRAWNTPPTGT